MSRDTERSLRDDLMPVGPVAEDLEDLALGDDYALNPDFVALVVDAADRGDAERLRELLAALHPADVADLMGFLSAGDREEVMAHLDPEALAEILAEIEPEIREELLERMPSATLVRALGEMDSDDAVDLVEDLEADKRAQVLAALPDVDRAAIETSLAYEDESAGRLMQREVASAPQFWTVGQALDHPERARPRAQHLRHEERHQRIDQVGGRGVQEADRAEQPPGGRQAAAHQSASRPSRRAAAATAMGS